MGNYEQLKTRLETMLRRPRPLKPQTERQLQQHLAEHNSSLPQLLLCAADILEEYELDIVFGPLFTPSLDDRIELADLLLDGKPDSAEIALLVPDVCGDLAHVPVRLPDGTEAQLSLHPVMLERFVQLLRFDSAADPDVAKSLSDSLPAQLVPVAVALLCETGMNSVKQRWFAGFVRHLASRGEQFLSRGLLETVTEFIASQTKIDREQLLASARALRVATESTAAHASSGHAYWSPDVAQHHQYRGQGHIDRDRAERNQVELERVNAMVDELEKFEYVTSDE